MTKWRELEEALREIPNLQPVDCMGLRWARENGAFCIMVDEKPIHECSLRTQVDKAVSAKSFAVAVRKAALRPTEIVEAERLLDAAIREIS